MLEMIAQAPEGTIAAFGLLLVLLMVAAGCDRHPPPTA